MRQPRHRPLPLLAAAAVLAALAGCGEPTQEERFQEARDEAATIESRLEDARTVLEERRKEYQATQQALEEARQKVASLEEEHEAALVEVRRYATDDVLFRQVQERLLEDDELSKVAISATVESGIVTLRGDVPDASLGERAEELASGVAGVRAVQSRIEVTPAQPRPQVEAPRPQEPAAGADQ